MKNIIVAACLVLSTCIVNAEQITLNGHKLNIENLDCINDFCTGSFNDNNGYKWGVLAKQNDSASINFIRIDQYKTTRAWIMTVKPKSSKEKIKSSLIGVDVDCNSFTTRVVHISLYDTFFCEGKSKQRSKEIRDPFVPPPGSLFEAASVLVCSNLHQANGAK